MQAKIHAYWTLLKNKIILTFCSIKVSAENIFSKIEKVKYTYTHIYVYICTYIHIKLVKFKILSCKNNIAC